LFGVRIKQSTSPHLGKSLTLYFFCFFPLSPLFSSRSLRRERTHVRILFVSWIFLALEKARFCCFPSFPPIFPHVVLVSLRLYAESSILAADNCVFCRALLLFLVSRALRGLKNLNERFLDRFVFCSSRILLRFSFFSFDLLFSTYFTELDSIGLAVSRCLSVAPSDFWNPSLVILEESCFRVGEFDLWRGLSLLGVFLRPLNFPSGLWQPSTSLRFPLQAILANSLFAPLTLRFTVNRPFWLSWSPSPSLFLLHFSLLAYSDVGFGFPFPWLRSYFFSPPNSFAFLSIGPEFPS